MTTTFDLESSTATKSFTDLYVEYASEITDAPPIYHKWLSYLILSSAINKKIFMKAGIVKLYPNFYFLIIGPSSAYRKSYSQKIAWRLIRKIYPEFKIMETSSEPTFIAEYARTDRDAPLGCGLMLIDEFSGFMTKTKSDKHFEQFITRLSSLFDAEDILKRTDPKEQDKVILDVKEPFLNISAACSYDWLTRTVEVQHMTGGFLARFLWVVAHERTGELWDEEREPDYIKENELTQRLTTIKEMIGEMTWSFGAKEEWRAWYYDFRNKHQGGFWDANYERITKQIKKIAMCNAAQNFRFEIMPEDLHSAIALCNEMVGSLADIVIGDTPADIRRKREFAFIRKKGPRGATRSELLNGMSGLDAKTLTDDLNTLKESEKIIEIHENGSGPKRTIYKVKRAADV